MAATLQTSNHNRIGTNPGSQYYAPADEDGVPPADPTVSELVDSSVESICPTCACFPFASVTNNPCVRVPTEGGEKGTRDATLQGLVTETGRSGLDGISGGSAENKGEKTCGIGDWNLAEGGSGRRE